MTGARLSAKGCVCLLEGQTPDAHVCVCILFVHRSALFVLFRDENMFMHITSHTLTASHLEGFYRCTHWAGLTLQFLLITTPHVSLQEKEEEEEEEQEPHASVSAYT